MSVFFVFLWAVDSVGMAMVAPVLFVLLGALGGVLAAPLAIQAVIGRGWLGRSWFDKIALTLLAAVILGGTMGGVGCAATYAAYHLILKHRSYC